jgi:hypothetical protein
LAERNIGPDPGPDRPQFLGVQPQAEKLVHTDENRSRVRRPATQTRPRGYLLVKPYPRRELVAGHLPEQRPGLVDGILLEGSDLHTLRLEEQLEALPGALDLQLVGERDAL